MPNNKQYISFGTSAGICNRIKRLASALRFEVDKTRPLDFYWSISDLCNHSFKELFIYEPYDVNEITCKVKVELDDAHDVGHNNGWRLVIKDGEVPSGFTKAFKKDADDKEIACEIAAEISKSASKIIELPDRKRRIEVSIGIAIYDGIETNYSDLFKKADIALP